MRTIEKTVFSFAELSDSAKEKARAWWRDAEAQSGDNFFAESVIEDAATIADLMGINLRQRPVKLMDGGTRYEPAVYWSGFSSQGDGACFEGSYTYRKGSVAAVKAHAPCDARLAAIAETLADAQRRNFYRLEASVKHTGRYSHEMSTEIDVFDREDNYRDIGDAGETVTEALRDFMRWIYRQLEAEYNYTMSDESVDESITANEYEFDGEGRMAA